MNIFRQLIAVVAAAATMGSVQAQDLGTLSPTTQTQTGFYASGESFVDIYNFTIDAQYQTLLASAVNFTPSGTDPSMTHVTDLTLTLFGGSNATGSALATVSSSNGSLIDWSSALISGSYSARISGLADGGAGGGFLFSVAATPEPAEWMMLLAGLMVVGFIARRRTSLVTG